MGNPKLLIGLIWLFVMTQLLCNWFEGNDMYENTNIAVSGNATQYYSTSSVDQTGTPATFVSIGKTIWEFCAKLFFFDYSIFYDVNAVTGVKTANFLSFFRYLLIAIGIVMWIDLAITARRSLFGG